MRNIFFFNRPEAIPKNPPSCLAFLSVVPFNKISLFSRKLVYFTISFISWFVSAIASLSVVGDFLIKLICFLFPNYFSAVCANLTAPSFAAFIAALNVTSSKPLNHHEINLTASS